ncbi:TetR family transcriptional regulator [Angustibacter sp. McL0619]|uniref:TetR/AcrR family transcriptional regulator n=1 Tax=Angustibacter sp. McL0619 TaxID=3415676 RepID=UPI003CFB740B
MNDPQRPRGRRPAGSDTRADIVTAARETFAEHGYEATSLRGVARRAGVDPALVHHYFADKAALFSASQELPFNPTTAIDAAIEGDPATVGERIVRVFLGAWDTEEGTPRIRALINAASTHEDAARTLREFLAREIFGRVVKALGSDQPELRGSLLASQLVGLAMARYVVHLEPLASASEQDVVRWLAPTVQRYLTGELD